MRDVKTSCVVALKEPKSTSKIMSADRSGMSQMPNRKLVLVVDDDAAMLRAVKRLLRQHDHEPILFSSAQSFKCHTDFDEAVCIILDINLQDGSGSS